MSKQEAGAADAPSVRRIHGDVLMFSFASQQVVVLLGVAGLFQQPHLVFHSVASDQPQIVEGVPAWEDKLLFQGDTVVVRHLRYQPVYISLSARLKVSRDTLKVFVTESPPPPDGGVPPAGDARAYEVRIGPLQSGRYVLVLNDDDHHPGDPRAFLLMRQIVMP
jgi:hypothetical protein